MSSLLSWYLVGVLFLCQTSYPVTSCVPKNWAFLSYHLSSQGDQDDGDNQTKYKQLAVELLLIMLELLECLGEPGVLVAVMVPLITPSPCSSVGVGWAWTWAAPALICHANHTASASPNSLWPLGKGLIICGLLLRWFLGEGAMSIE